MIDYKMTDVEIYESVLSGKLKRFPNGFWHGEEGLRSSKKIVLYIIEEKNKWTEDELLNNFTVSFLRKNKLAGMFSFLFKGVVFDVLDNAYPGKYKPWQLKKASSGIWNLENAKLATIWLIEDRLHWDRKQICKGLTRSLFKKNSLNGLMSMPEIMGSPYKALCNAYGPDFVKPWELQTTPMGFWTDKTIREAIQWLVIDKGYTKESLMELNKNDLTKYGLFVAYSKCHESIVQLLNKTYPNEYEKVGNVLYYLPTMTRYEKPYKNNASTISGVSLNNKRKKYKTQLQINGKVMELGLTEDKEEAKNRRLKAESQFLKETIMKRETPNENNRCDKKL